MALDLPRALSDLEAAFRARGFDLLQPFSVRSWNELSAEEDRLPLFEGPDAWGFVVGNSRALWEPFVAWVRGREPLPAHPLDTYTEETLAQLLPALGARCWWRGAHELEPRPLPIQRIADAAGLAPLGPAHLNVHPRFGPWIALRAVVVLDWPGAPPPPATPVRWCAGCPAPCREALERALSILSHHAPGLEPPGAPPEPRGDRAAALPLDERRRLFLRVRDACPVGVSARYSDAQIVYHYMSDPRVFD